MMTPLQRSVRDNVAVVVDAPSACATDFACVDLVVSTAMEVTSLGVFFLLDGGCDVVEMEFQILHYNDGDNVTAAAVVVTQVLRRIWFGFECGESGCELVTTIMVDRWRW
ncbi:Hypothetical predicted protein [Olea europaea subsp. europaea]|uniref:Uncharacterized protein n=1 Tax=Olea europaea subsp. europaea TaxID=158383 RepID=A0A8S0T1A4_OLEEU|nr:Hypothetical predicted protein [Olea europaea subsp. europaea]